MISPLRMCGERQQQLFCSLLLCLATSLLLAPPLSADGAGLAQDHPVERAPLGPEWTTVRLQPGRGQERVQGESRAPLVREQGEVPAVPLAIDVPPGIVERAGQEAPGVKGPALVTPGIAPTLHEQAPAREPLRSLDQFIARAVAVNPDLEVARRARTVAHRRATQAMRELFPQARMELEWTEGSISGGHFGGRREAGVFRQPIFHGGTLWNALKRYRAEYEAAEREIESELQTTYYDVTDAFIELSRAQQTVLGQDALLRRVYPLYEINERKWREKLIAEVEYLYTDALFHQIVASREAALQQEMIARLALARQVEGRAEELSDLVPIYDPVRLASTVQPPESVRLPAVGDPRFQAELDEFVQLAYRYRADLGAERNRVRANVLAQKAARGTFMPNVDFFVELGQLAEAFRDTDKSPPFLHEFRFGFETSWNVGGSTARYVFDSDSNAPSLTQFASGGEGSSTRRNTFTMALLDGLDDFVASSESALATAQSRAAQKELEKNIVQEIHEAFFRYHEARIRIYSLSRESEYRQKLVDLAKLRLDANEIETSEFLEAIVRLGEDEEQLHAAVADYFKAKAALNRGTGRPVLALAEDSL